MKYFMSEEEAAYMTMYQGHFSRKMAEWAIGNMEADGKPVTEKPFDEVMEIMKANGVTVSEECRYDAWYLFMMAVADYPKTMQTDKQRVSYVEETICDPDGKPTNVLACFVAKMCNMGVPVMWEMFV